VRPALKAGLLPLWRDRDTVQFGIDPRRAVALTGLAGAAGLLRLLDGSRDRDQVIAAARDQGIPAPLAEQVLALLAACGVLDDYPAAALGALTQEQRGRLAAERAAAALAGGHSDGGARILARRAAARVRLHGHGRVASLIADILLTSGVGTVTAAGSGGTGSGGTGASSTRPPGGDGRPAGRTRRPARRLPLPDLAILVGWPALTDTQNLPARLVRAGVSHLAVTAEEAIGVVGPLVRPGQTACLRCLDRIRAGHDPAWPLILAQLGRRGADPPACDAALAAAVAGQASAQALAYLDAGRDGGPEPGGHPAENGTLELVQPGWQWRRRTWLPQPDCDCRAAESGPAASGPAGSRPAGPGSAGAGPAGAGPAGAGPAGSGPAGPDAAGRAPDAA
jgi:bacteriocin biosynthesis cyclodehydratase domain-containing protein